MQEKGEPKLSANVAHMPIRNKAVKMLRDEKG
jgi:hypothetical protein